MASPLIIAMGLHYYARCDDFEPERLHAPAVQDALSVFVAHGMLQKLDEPNEYGATYVATDGLRVWCEALCSINWPVQEWIMPKGPGS
jgi:hypothetical protein